MIDSGSPEAIARDKIAERGFADTLRELETLKRTDRESRDEWLKSWGFGLFAVLKHGPIGEVLALLQDGWISRGKAAEAMAEIMLGNKANLPESKSSAFDDLDIPGEVVTELRRCAFELSNDKDMALGKLDQALTERDAARAEAAMLREALEQLENEVKGMIEFREIALREVLGCTNVQVLSQRVAEAEAALSGSSGEWLERHDAEKLEGLRHQLTVDAQFRYRAEAERDGLAVALKAAEVTIESAMKSASVNNLSAAGGHLAAYQLAGKDYASILAARDARIKVEARRKALLEAAERMKSMPESWGAEQAEYFGRLIWAELRRMARGADHA